MGFDVGGWTVRVLEEGLPPLPDRLEPSQTVPVAVWRGERYGAVLFVRRWTNGNVDSDCAITERGGTGSWAYPQGWGGGGWIDDPPVRSEAGWDGKPVVWLRVTESYGVRVVAGAASTNVAGIEVEQAEGLWSVPIDSPCGAFVVGIESGGPGTLRALDEGGSVLRARGATRQLW
jgi:hypothetical protein